MKLPFGSRSSKTDSDLDLDEYDEFEEFADDFEEPVGADDFDGLFHDDGVEDEFDIQAREAAVSAANGPISEATGNAVPPPEGRETSRRLRRPRRAKEEHEDPQEHDEFEDPVGADDFSTEMERLQSEASAEQRSAWAYLGVLTGLFGFLVLFGYGCSNQGEPEIATGEAVEMLETGQPSQLVFRVEGDIITLQGTVPTEASRSQLLAQAQSIYGPENVLDEMTVDAGFSFEAGTIRSVGSAAFQDDRAQSLHDLVGNDFGLADRGFEVGFVETVLSAVNAQIEVDGDLVALSGALPDQQSIDDLTALANDTWGAASVDSSLLTIGETTWTEGRIRLTGRAVSTDQRIQDFTAAVPDRLGLLIAVDTAGLVVDDISELLAEINTQIETLVAANPILFEPLSADIDPASDTVLTDLAELLGQLPTTDFEVVGYTDSVGDDQENLLLSQERAQAVVDRLGQLGIAPERMTSRGEGEANPIDDNTTDEGRAANRRIEFVFVGADLTDESTAPDDTTTTTEG